MEQQLLFPELDPYKTKIKDIEYVDRDWETIIVVP